MAPVPNLDTVTTIREDGSRLFLHPADARGRYTAARRWTALVLIAAYLALPWIKIGGYPALFLDLEERRFHLFGWTLAAQDLWLMFFLISGVGFGLFFVTALWGRVWCGWACPQTVFLEHVYRRVERWIEGDATKRRRLDAAPLNDEKIAKRTAKHVIFVLLSAAIAHLLVAYFVSVPGLWRMMSEAPAQHWPAFLFVAATSGILYFNFAWFREQLCIVICPYGRLQSALIDDQSMVIGYDAARGEPRGKAHTSGAGDCVDCTRCVQVCPTGIDIRQGLQIECIGCTACIDACDEVMTKLQRPRGLIRYDSLNGFAGKPTRLLRPRTIVYLVLFVVGALVASWALSTIQPASMGVTRMQGAPYFVDASYVRNQFMVRLVNKRNQSVRLQVRVIEKPQGALVSGFEEAVEVAPMAETVRPLIVQVPRAIYAGTSHLQVRLTDESGRADITRKVEFLGPDKELLGQEEQEREMNHDK